MSAARTERLLNLLTLLLNAPRPMPLADIRVLEAFQAYRAGDPKSGERAFERDKAALLALGVPLQWTPPNADDDDGGGYSIDTARYYLASIDVTPEQRTLLGIAGAAAATLAGSSGGPAVRRALAKLGFDAACVPAALEQAVAHAPLAVGTDVAQLAAHLDVLHRALAGRHQVVLTYAQGATSAPARQRHVDPYGLFYRHGAWYLVGFCHLRNAQRTFHVGRIQHVAVHSEPKAFVRPADFDIRRSAEVRPWQYPKAPPIEVTIRLAERLVGAVAEIFGPKVEVHKDAIGAFVRLQVGHPAALIACILPLGAAAEVMTPAPLRQEICALYAQLERRYGAAVGTRPKAEVAS
jgi:proteasome accessory factor B